MCLYVFSSVLWCPLRFPHKNDVRFVFTSSCLYEGWCLIYVICICLRSGVQHILCCVFILLFVVLCTLWCLDFPFLIAPSFWFDVIYIVLTSYIYQPCISMQYLTQSIRFFRIISIPSKCYYFRPLDHMISMECSALDFRCQCTQQKLQPICAVLSFDPQLKKKIYKRQISI
jgi:hypothetical protein